MFGWLKRKITSSPIMVMTGPGVLKTHDVEAKFRQDISGGNRYFGKLVQSRWSDGQERFSLRLRGLASGHDGKLRLYRDGDQVSEFDLAGSAIDFRWKGMSSDTIPKFEIGDRLRIDVGPMSIAAIVEPD